MLIKKVYEATGNPDYIGTHRHEVSEFQTESFLKSKYDEYNRRFFGNQLSQKIPIELEDTVKAGKKSGAYDFKPYYANHPDIPFPDMPHSFVEVGDAIIKPIRIWISKRKWKSRFKLKMYLFMKCVMCTRFIDY